jgi:tRNA dimethylallyltransferase
VIAGPTASGKTALAVRVAERLGAEIISADSMQFYRGMEIGAGAPSAEELRRVKHHFIGFIDPSREFSAGLYASMARDVVDNLLSLGRIPVIVGGSGLYIRALLDGLFEGPGKDPKIRERIYAEAREFGAAPLFERLTLVDPDYAHRIEPNDLRRIARALEVFELTGRPLSVLHHEHQESASRLDAVQVALDFPRDVLYARINARVDAMLEAGLLDEVRMLIERGWAGHIERLRSLGYREMAAHIRGECSLEEAVELMKMNTRRYAKRQLSWFRGDSRIHWLSVDEDSSDESLADATLELLMSQNGCLMND